jgi:hypothetical protein
MRLVSGSMKCCSRSSRAKPAISPQVSASRQRLRTCSKTKREPVDTCCDYILDRADMVRCDEYLADGLPIASGVIEGACRILDQKCLISLRNLHAVQ